MDRRSVPPPGLSLPPGYRWSWWKDTRAGCFFLACGYTGAALVFFAASELTHGWLSTVFTALQGLAGFMVLGSLLGVALPTTRGWYWDSGE